MSWSSWSAKLNVQSIVSQGLEQVSKLKEDVEKQFDQVVTSASQAPGSQSRASAGAAAAAAEIEPPSAAVSAALFGDSNGNSNVAIPAPPPRSMDGKSSSAALLASLGIPKSSSGVADAGASVDTPSSAPPSSTSKGSSSAEDFFGSFLPPDKSKATASSISVPMPPVSDKEHGDSMDTAPPQLVVPVRKETPETESSIVKEATGADSSTQESEGPGDAVETKDAAAFDPVDSATIENEHFVDEESATAVENDGEMAPEDTLAELVGDTLAEEEVYGDASSQVDRSGDGAIGAVEVQDGEVNGKQSDEREDVVQENGEHSPVNGVHEKSEDELPSVKQVSSVSSDEVDSLKQQLAQRETQLMSTSAVIQELHDELDKTCQREVAAVERSRSLTEQLELLRQEVLRLNRIVVQQQQQSSRDHEFAALQQAIAEKDTKLQALLDEGQALSVKQSQLEQRLRQLRREKNDEEEQKLKLQAQNDTFSIQLQELLSKQKAAEEDKKEMQSELKTVQLNAEQTKKELTAAQTELANRKETSEQLEADVLRLGEKNDALQSELDKLHHTSMSHATLSVEKSEMETTIQYLQQTVRDLEVENARREDTARLEITDLKRKWKDALQRVEALGQSVSEATQPLLRQIHALQEDQRARQETWKATEATLVQRIYDASAQRKEFESEKVLLEQQLHSLHVQVEDLQLDIQRKQADSVRERERAETAVLKEREARSKCDALQIELDEVKLKLQEEHHAKQALLTRVAMVAAADSTSKRDNDAQFLAETTTLVTEMQQLKQREEKLRHDLEWHQKELQRVKAASSSPRMGMLQNRRSFDGDWRDSTNGSPRVSSQNSSQASILQRTLESSVDDSRLSSTSVLGMSQLQQRLRLREGENGLLRQQLQAIEDKQKQTTDEIVRLSTRNALLESSAAQFEQAQQELEQLKQKQHVLLELFGEKEEQVEELQSEVKELKAFYRKQLDTLAGQQR